MIHATRFIKLKSPLMRGPDILEVQEKLTEQGFHPGALDGIFGLATDKALRQFQKSHGLKADGVAGPNTWKELNMSSPSYEQQTKLSIQSNGPRIHVHVDTRILNMTLNGTITTYPVAIGRPSTPTPVGEWTVVAKAVDPGGPFGVRWMRLSCPWGSYGIHGTNNPKSIGKAVSHGCIRLYNEDVVVLYDLTPIGTPVSITGIVRKIRNLKLGYRGNDVKDIQQMLFDLGYYLYSIDGYYGRKTRQAVLSFQKDQGLRRDGIAGPKTLKALQTAHDFAMDNITL